MARHKRSKSRGRSFFARRSSHRRSSSTGMNPLNIALPSAIYGAVRGYAVSMLTPLISMVPAGAYADELVLGGLGYFAAKKGKGFVRNAGFSILAIEAFRAGSTMGGGLMGTSTTPSSTNYNGWT